MPDFDINAAIGYIAARLRDRGDGARRGSNTAGLPAGEQAHWLKRVDALVIQANKLAEFLTAGSMPNVWYKDMTSQFNRDIQDAWDAVSPVYPYPSIHTAPGQLRRAGPGSPEHEFLTNIVPLVDAMRWFKEGEGRINKRVPKAPEDVKAKYLAPRAGDDARARVQRALCEVVDAQFNQLAGTFQTRLDAEIGWLVDQDVGFDRSGPVTDAHIRKLYAVARKENRRIDVADLSRWIDLTEEERGARILDLAMQRARDIRDQFVIKNLQKLDSIVEKKGNFDKIEVLGFSLSMASMEGQFLLSFKDGSRFEARNAVVFVENQNGTRFNRFPLTFHDVVLPDGRFMPKPSEERMNTVFVGA